MIDRRQYIQMNENDRIEIRYPKHFKKEPEEPDGNDFDEYRSQTYE